MPAKNCARCHKIFNQNYDETICPICKESDELSFQRIKAYLYDHQGATATEVANVLDIPIRIIKYYLREGRLEVVGDVNYFLECEKCGTPIRTGHYCIKCLVEFQNKLKAMNGAAAANYKRLNPDKFPDDIIYKNVKSK